MNKYKFLSMALITILITGIHYTWNSRVRAGQTKSIDPEEKDQITNTVQAYFEARYRTFSTLKMESFDGLIEDFYTEILSNVLSLINWIWSSIMHDTII